MRASLRRWLLLLSVMLIPHAVRAQAVITGTVKDASGAVLPGVTVEATSPALIEKVRTGGHRRNRPVPHRGSAARHLHRDVLAAGLQHVQARRHRADAARSRRPINADLKVGSLAETVTVTGESPIVDVQSARRETVVSATTFSRPSRRFAATTRSSSSCLASSPTPTTSPPARRRRSSRFMAAGTTRAA